MKYCKNCGGKVGEAEKFCKKCGTKINAPESVLVAVPAHKKILSIISERWPNKRSAIAIIGAIALLIILATCWVAYAGYGSINHAKKSEVVSAPPDNSQAVVNIWCDNGQGGSGTIFTTTGTILTNNHVITGATSCKVTIPDPATGQIAQAYEAAPIIVPILSKKYDVATLQIDASYTDSSGKTWGEYPTTFTPFTLPSTCSTSTPSKLGDSIRIYGYPVTSGGYDLTVTDGIISSFVDNGDILTSAKVDSGNSGGLAIDQNGCYLGIPSAVISGNYQNLGVLIPGNVVKQFIPNIPVKMDLVTKITGTQDMAAQAAITPHVAAPITPRAPNAPQATPSQRCQATYGTYSQYVGDNSQGQPLCNCQTGYAWSGSGNSCVAQTDLQAYCQATYGAGSYSSTVGGKAQCGCSTGYSLNSDQTACVVTQPSCTTFASYNTSTGSCECDSGYMPSGSICESNLTYCQNKEGYGATYQAYGNSCACKSGYFLNNGQCQDGYTYCSEKYPGDIYDSSTNACKASGY